MLIRTSNGQPCWQSREGLAACVLARRGLTQATIRSFLERQLARLDGAQPNSLLARVAGHAERQD